MSDPDPLLLTVRDAAQRLGVTPRTLKYYEERGIVTPSRSDGRYRLYSESDLATYQRVLRLRSLGFSIDATREILKRPQELLHEGKAGYSTEALRDIASAVSQQREALVRRISDVRKELQEAEAIRDDLTDDLNYLMRRIEGATSESMAGERLAMRERRKKN
ncbi:MAG: MerR family transcriptional regulator [Acidovorax sp.]